MKYIILEIKTYLWNAENSYNIDFNKYIVKT